MDELTLLRKVHNDIPNPTSEVLGDGRTALFERIARPERMRSASRRRIRWAGFGVLGAGALTATLVLTNVVGLAGWRGGAEPAAADVLRSAALAAIENPDPVVGPGQYLLVETTSVHVNGGPAEDGTHTNYAGRVEHELYIPANRDDDWVWARHPETVLMTYGAGFRDVSSSSENAYEEELVRAPGGGFYGGAPTMSLDDLEALPREPALLLNHIYRVTVGMGPSPDGEALVFIADRLRYGVIGAEQRAVFYEAAALIPGITITEGRATLNGTTGVAIGRDEGRSFRQEIIVDPGSGLFIGERQITLSGYLDVPAGTVTSSSAVTTSVVNSAPKGGTVNGIFDVMGCISDGKGNSQCPKS